MGSVRFDPQVEAKIRQVAARKGLTLSEVHRQAVAEYLERETSEKKTSRYDDVIGVGEGPGDLSERVSEIFGEIMRQKYD